MPYTAGQRLLASTLNADSPQLLGSTILSGLTTLITITIPTGFNHLQGIFTGRQDTGSGGAFCTVRLNGDSGSNYTWQVMYGSGASATSANSGGLVTGIRVGVLPGSGDAANYFGTGTFDVGNISSTVAYKPVASNFQGNTNTVAGFAGSAGGLWQSTAAVTSVTLLPNSGNLVAGSSLTVYGWS